MTTKRTNIAGTINNTLRTLSIAAETVEAIDSAVDFFDNANYADTNDVMQALAMHTWIAPADNTAGGVQMPLDRVTAQAAAETNRFLGYSDTAERDGKWNATAQDILRILQGEVANRYWNRPTANSAVSERELEDRAAELDAREKALAARESDMDTDEADMDNIEEHLAAREAALNAREKALQETALQQDKQQEALDTLAANADERDEELDTAARQLSKQREMIKSLQESLGNADALMDKLGL